MWLNKFKKQIFSSSLSLSAPCTDFLNELLFCMNTHFLRNCDAIWIPILRHLSPPLKKKKKNGRFSQLQKEREEIWEIIVQDVNSYLWHLIRCIWHRDCTWAASVKENPTEQTRSFSHNIVHTPALSLKFCYLESMKSLTILCNIYPNIVTQL